MISRLCKLLKRKTEYEKMEAYFSQAQDMVHLEILQRNWDKGIRE